MIDQIVDQVRQVAGGRSPAAVGVGIPSIIEFATGRVRSSVNIPLHDVALREELGRRLGTLVFVDNDATLAALAEAHDEGGRLTARNLVMLTVGTGVGGGIVIDGRIYRGSTGAAGELGHTMIAADPDRDYLVDPPDDTGCFPRAGVARIAGRRPRARSAGPRVGRRAPGLGPRATRLRGLRDPTRSPRPPTATQTRSTSSATSAAGWGSGSPT